MQADLKQHVLAAAQRPEVLRAVADLYAHVQQEIDRRRPICLLSGRCCRFEDFGHRLYVTTMELASFAHDLAAAGNDPSALMTSWDGTGCPFQAGKLCTVHAFRPFGCRIFFCDATATQWQNQAYERFHGQLKRLHDELDVPYAYVEWREALRTVL